jgi:hypothetical protein
MAVKLGWFDASDKQLLEQELVAAVRPGPPAIPSETNLELQTTFRPVGSTIEFGKTNFGFLGVRVARSISVFFGGGMLTNSEGRQGERTIFGNKAGWMDYSGPISEPEQPVIEGITYFDHPDNVGFPSAWHVREDGWMCCSACMQNPLIVERDKPLQLRYLLRAHAKSIYRPAAEATAEQFRLSAAWQVEPSEENHIQFVVRRNS